MPGNLLPHWELCKENAKPLKRGRDVKRLERALTAGKPITPTTEGVKATPTTQESMNTTHFEALVREDALLKDSDPVGTWIRYIEWAREENPSDSRVATKLMERCGRAFEHNPDFKNDERLIKKVWLSYIDQQANPDEIFRHLYRHRIGLKVAWFWVAWAFVSEKAGRHKFADKLFTKALDEGATPRSFIMRRMKQFHRRIARRMLTSQNDERNPMHEIEEELHVSMDATQQRIRSRSDHSERDALKALQGENISRKCQMPHGLQTNSDTYATRFQIFSETEPILVESTLLDTKYSNDGETRNYVESKERSKENVDTIRKWNSPPIMDSISRNVRRDAIERPPSHSQYTIFVDDNIENVISDKYSVSHPVKEELEHESVKSCVEMPTCVKTILEESPQLHNMSEHTHGFKCPVQGEQNKKQNQKDIRRRKRGTAVKLGLALSGNINKTRFASSRARQHISYFNLRNIAKDNTGMEMQFEEQRGALWLEKSIADGITETIRQRTPEIGLSNETYTESTGEVTINTAMAFKVMQGIFGSETVQERHTGITSGMDDMKIVCANLRADSSATDGINDVRGKMLQLPVSPRPANLNSPASIGKVNSSPRKSIFREAICIFDESTVSPRSPLAKEYESMQHVGTTKPKTKPIEPANTDFQIPVLEKVSVPETSPKTSRITSGIARLVENELGMPEEQQIYSWSLGEALLASDVKQKASLKFDDRDDDIPAEESTRRETADPTVLEVLRVAFRDEENV